MGMLGLGEGAELPRAIGIISLHPAPGPPLHTHPLRMTPPPPPSPSPLPAGKLGLDAADFAKRLAAEKELQAATTAALKAWLAPPAAAGAAATGLPPPPAGGGSSASSSSARGGAGGGRGSSSSSASDAAAAAAAVPPPPPPACNVAFDESGHFLVFPTMAGIKLLNTVSNRVCAVLGRVESSERFLCVALYQGVPQVSSQYALQRAQAAGQAAPVMSQQQPPGGAAATGGGGAGGARADPTIVAVSYRRNRFFLFSRREPAELLTERCVRPH